MAPEGIRYGDAATPEGMRIYAVGDIHGRHDLMAEMHSRIMAEIIEDRPADWRIVYLGDYVDRGPASRQVLEHLSQSVRNDPRVTALAGNHDLGFLAFLAQPRAEGLFARNGGEATARSYSVEIDFGSSEALSRGHAALMEAIPREHLDFLHGLKLSASFGDFFFCHAGIRPGVPLEAQSAEDLIWIRERFRHDPTLHPKLVVHGHTPMPEPEIMLNRVNLDTGAWSTGRLTAMMFEGKKKRLLEVVLEPSG
ncbi:metallophosphoesterase family protein [Chelativorans sp. AA-79]|uniref:metallophosphoesterase family protein n=1 Tax=Chelativorans sp. AA-79 TaxID=3028735 RepID=UPI0023F7FA7D|nr:metallophosphoesterase family protein [Chelativorans sp. AA-79]WEX08465.1 metallophosphoesterase family protein [Chelativorans sp. AA-79]